MKTKKHIIWSDDINLDDWRDYLLEENPDLSEGDLWMEASFRNAEYLDDERMNLDMDLEDNIVVFADLGLWNGRTSGYKTLNSRNIKSCLYASTRDAVSDEWYVDELGDLRCREGHHDGTNYYLYRVWKPGTSYQRRMNLLEKVYNGTATRRDITRCTSRIGDRVARVYGW